MSFYDGVVAILILLELTLQSEFQKKAENTCPSRNPYFIGINSAIRVHHTKHEKTGSRNPYFIGINSAMLFVDIDDDIEPMSQSLFYWN